MARLIANQQVLQQLLDNIDNTCKAALIDSTFNRLGKHFGRAIMERYSSEVDHIDPTKPISVQELNDMPLWKRQYIRELHHLQRQEYRIELHVFSDSELEEYVQSRLDEYRRKIGYDR